MTVKYYYVIVYVEGKGAYKTVKFEGKESADAVIRFLIDINHQQAEIKCILEIDASGNVTRIMPVVDGYQIKLKSIDSAL